MAPSQSTIKRRRAGWILAVALCFLTLAYFGRGYIRDGWDWVRRPRLPAASAFRPPVSSGDNAAYEETTSPFESGYSTSENFILETSPRVKKPVDSLAFSGVLPKEVNLSVPFTSQAPYADWSMPYQETCEEASLIMVDAFYRGQTERLPKDEAKRAIDKMVAFEKNLFGYYEDTTAAETARLAREYFGYKQAVVKPLEKPDDIKRVLALGYPVIIPASGKLLNNPNYRNGGPPYHMLVVRGYTSKYFITNDSGTRKGEGYTYDYATLMNAAHDWNGGDVKNGKRLMIIVLPDP